MKDLETKLGFLLCCQYFVILFDNIGVKYYEFFFQKSNMNKWNGSGKYKKYENA